MTTPGIHLDISSEDYHAGPGISKSGLWTIAKRTPAHYKFGERKPSKAFDLGTAAHTAILEPEKLDDTVAVGPAVNKNTNVWKAAAAEAEAYGRFILDPAQWDDVRRIRDSAAGNEALQVYTRDAIIEPSGYALDPLTDVPIRCRPDAWNQAHGVILDLKTAVDGSPGEFGRASANFGYHFQEAFYTDAWTEALIAEHGTGLRDLRPLVEAFVFVVVEKTAPFLVSTYELKPAAVDEGRAHYRAALDLYAQCLEREQLGMPADKAWPGYSPEPEPLDIPGWAYRYTPRPGAEEI